MSDKLNAADRLAGFLVEKRVLVIVLLVLVVIIAVGAAVWSPVRQNMMDNRAMMAEDLDQSFSDWIYADEENRDEQEESFLALAEEALAVKGAPYTVQRALFLRGQYYVSQEMWSEATADYALLAEDYPQSYLAPVALFNAGSTSEQNGDNTGAAAYYTQLVDTYSETAPEAAEALFNLGRLAEAEGNKDEAVSYYERLIADYSTSDWKNIAKTRILIMK